MTQAPYTLNWTGIPAGTYNLQTKATTRTGIVVASNTATVTITVASHTAPTVRLGSTATGTLTAPASVPLEAVVTTSDQASVSRVEFYDQDQFVGSLSQPPYRITLPNVSAGSHRYTARVSDSLGAQTVSDPLIIDVTAVIPAQVYYIEVDQINTPRVITNSANQIVWRWDNTDPFGNNPPDENPSGKGTFRFNLRFPGQYFDKETNLHYNYFRDYDPSTGRYIESDPIGLKGGINTYTYVYGIPIIYVDKKGLKPGDSFSSPEEAAVDAIRYINPSSICQNREYGGYVYKNWGWGGTPTYTYDEPTLIGELGGAMPDRPSFHDTYGAYHTHGAHTPGYADENFSPEDMDMGDNMGVPTYLGTPKGFIKQYMPDPKRNHKGAINNVGKTDTQCPPPPPCK